MSQLHWSFHCMNLKSSVHERHYHQGKMLQCQLKHRCLVTSSLLHNEKCHIHKLLQTWRVTFLTSIGSCLLSCWSWEWAHPAASHQWWACDGWHIFFGCHTAILHFASLTTHKTFLLQTARWMTWQCRALQIPGTKSTWHLYNWLWHL
jgi:hypothetical protein